MRNIDVSNIHGTAIFDALKASYFMLKVIEQNQAKVVILMTDGRENVASQQSQEELIEILRKEHIKVFALGIGSATGGALPGTEGISTLDSQTLQYVSNQTGGNYRELKELAPELFSSIITSHKGLVKHDLTIHLLLAGIATLFLEWALIGSRYLSIP